MKKVYIVGAKRTAIGAFLGSLKNIHPADLGSSVVKALVNDANISPEQIDEVICGNILSAGLGQGIGRQIAVKSDIPVEKCAYSLNMLCGSGMKAVMNGVASIHVNSLSPFGVLNTGVTVPAFVVPDRPAAYIGVLIQTTKRV